MTTRHPMVPLNLELPTPLDGPPQIALPRAKALPGNPTRRAHGLTLIGASAGSGKTHRLSNVVIDAVDPRGERPIALEGLLAVTFTRKAAAELEARIRRRLVATDARERAQQLPLAYVGTVHAVCLRLLEEFSMDAGLSPLVTIISGDSSRALRQALEWGLDPTLRERLESLASLLEIRFDSRIKRYDWLGPVEDIMTLARSNRIPAAALPAMARRSSERLRSLLGQPEPDGDRLDRDLLAALVESETAFGGIDDGQANTKSARTTVQMARRQAHQDTVPWSRWIALQKLQPGKSARAAVASLVAVAGQVDRHPRLHRELDEFTHSIYQAAAAGLNAYDAWKKQRRLVDFVDMVEHASSLVSLPDVARELSERLELVVVDEFQDTTPAQLALFTQLHQLAGRSAWVGDRKQCIFEYAGADPELMEAVIEWGQAEGAQPEALRDNWRSRPELVDFCSQLFSTALQRHGYTQEEVKTTARRKAQPDLAALPPLGIWCLGTGNLAASAGAMARGVARLLQNPPATPVVDRVTELVRPLRASDIAVLVATNAEAVRITGELAACGIRTSVARAGLLDTPEGTLVEAALGCLVDTRDRRSRAVIDALTGFDGTTPDHWLEALLIEHAAYHAARERGEQFVARGTSDAVSRVQALVADVELLAPSEVLDRVLSALDVAALCARWPDPEQRLANLDALRAMAARYEVRCAEQREAASAAGLLRFFAEARKKFQVGDEELASDDQHVSTSSNGVTVVTYHRAKGLEWPVVILGSLEREERRDAFTVLPESDRKAFDPVDPLGGRWIRYYPWPYGSHRSAPLAERVAASPEGRAVRDRETRERLRLLYVGFTRARDHLALAVRQRKDGLNAAWLDELCDAEGLPLLRLPDARDENDPASLEVRNLTGAPHQVAARVWSLATGTAEPARPSRVDSPRWFVGARAPVIAACRYHIAPSRGDAEWPDLALGEVGDALVTGPRLPLGSERPGDWSLVGDAMHAFLAADLLDLEAQHRLEVARRLLEASALLGLIAPVDLVHSADQLRRWIRARWPAATWQRELPVCGVIQSAHGMRRIEGSIDLLLQVDAGVILIDHKSYPGARSTWQARACEYLPQMAAYARALRMAGRAVLSQWISFPVAGGVVEIREREPSRSGDGERKEGDG